MNSRHIVHARCKGFKSESRVTLRHGLGKTIKSNDNFGIWIFEVPILGASMRGLPRELAFFMIFRLRPSAPTSIVSTHELLGGGGTF